MRHLEDALFEMTVANREPVGARHALMALGSLARWLASNPTARTNLRPPPLISSEWIREADDASAEFRVAAALAALGLPAPAHAARQEDASGPDALHSGGDGVEGTSTADQENAGSASESPAAGAADPAAAPDRAPSRVAPPMAAHFAPLNEGRFFYRGRLGTRRAWSGDDTPRTVVWGAGSLVSNLIAVLERRLVEASTRGIEDKPLSGAAPARLADVAAFLSADFDDARCAALLAGLVWARPARLRAAAGHPAPVPFAYAALKPLFTPDAALRAVRGLSATARLPVPPGLITRLRAGGDSRDGRATDAAVRVALARARASGPAGAVRRPALRCARRGSGRQPRGSRRTGRSPRRGAPDPHRRPGPLRIDRARLPGRSD